MCVGMPKNMKMHFLLPSVALVSWGTVPVAIAQATPIETDINPTNTTENIQPPLILKTDINPINTTENTQNSLQTPKTEVLRLNQIERLHTSAEFLVQKPTSTEVIQSPTNTTQPDSKKQQDEIEITVTGEKETFPETSTPIYTITEEEIQKQGANSVSEVLRNLPGFAINDTGFAADIHTGTYYRGSSINQSVFLINGRPINTNINTYHGATDLNSLPVGAIERVELSSGTSSTLYGSEAVGGVVNIITKKGQQIPRFDVGLQYGSYEQLTYRANYSGSVDSLRFNFGYEQNQADNRYRVPVGAANRDSEGRLFNGDTATSNYFGSLSLDINPRNTISLDAYKISSRKGLIYFGFPLQRDRLDHDAFNVGLSWKTLLSGGEDSVLTTTVAFNQDYFNTYGPTQNIFYRQGTLDSQAITGRIEHQWQIAANDKLIWGVDLQNQSLNGDVLSTDPNRISLNENENRDRFQAALFAVNTWNLTKIFQIDLGLRQNFTSEFGSYLNPSVGTRWAINPGVAVRGSWVSVQRNPGLDQLYVYDTVHGWLPNPDLKPETGSSWTAGLDVGLSRNLTGQFTYFGSSLTNRLGILAGKWQNIGLVDTNGFEAALRLQINPEFSTFLNYTYTDAQIKTGTEKGLQLSMVPYSVGQLGIGYASNGWQLNFLVSYNSGARRAFFVNPGESTTSFIPSWLNLDLNARIPVTRNIGLVAYLENLADVTYEKANRIYQPGLTFRVGVEGKF